MQEIGKLFSLLGIIFLILTLVFNIMPKLPRVPGDLYIDKYGFKLYVPFTSVIVLSVIAIYFFKFFKQ